MCNIDLEPCSAWSESIITARKDHVCDCCGGAIAAGNKYMRHFSVFDGHVTHEKQCSSCTAIVRRFLADHGQKGSPGSMRQLLEECIDYGDIDSRKWRRDLAAMNRRRRARASAAGHIS